MTKEKIIAARSNPGAGGGLLVESTLMSNPESSNNGNSFQSDLPKAYDPKNVESHWYDVWQKEGLFNPQGDGPSYTIVIPPPNVTGSLHMGHALNSTLQDILIRYRKMKGDSTLWVPGTDHGGIATQNVVEKLLKKEGMSRHDLGREKFLERMWDWRAQAGDTILMQLKRLGASLEWSRTRFTMDEVCSKAVRHAFVTLFKKNLMYRGHRLVNWCPRCHTALADIEVEHKDTNGHLWHIKYPLAEDPSKFILVATTRPETMLGDTAVAVHPEDDRYKHLVGKKILLPLTEREIPIVTDEVVDKDFGSGAVKVTPAHDPTDFEIAERANLPHITVIGFDAKMTKAAGADFVGLDRVAARKLVVEKLEESGLLEKTEKYKLSVSVCYRCDNVIEPLESEQWFLKMGEMAQRAREANIKGDVKIVPSSWEGPYQRWLENLHDWCVSRQIWWGHRIPVWYCTKEKDGKMVRSECPPISEMEDPTSCPKCGNSKLEQDPDVLDTWFSSALWPMSVFKWPEETDDLKKFFPTSTLVTGHEILYLWVARMVMFALEFKNEIPYKTVFIHGIVRDKQGRKMSKSLGNVIDPLELIAEVGADAVRFSLAQSAAPGRDMQISKENFISARNFSNKIWNATRFSLAQLSDIKDLPPISTVHSYLELSDRWILGRYDEVVRAVTGAMNAFDMDTAARTLYDFFWSDFCDWYLEMIKPRFDQAHWGEAGINRESKHAAQIVLGTILEGSLRMLHPFIPFITEELWERVPKPQGTTSRRVMSAHWPTVIGDYTPPDDWQNMKLLREIITKIRTIRSEMGINPGQPIDVVARVRRENVALLLREQEVILKTLNCRVANLKVDAGANRPRSSAAAVVPGVDLYVPLEGIIDFEKEKGRLEKELISVHQDRERLQKKIDNPNFVKNAPPEEIQKAEARLREAKERAKRIEENISAISVN